ncbi:hypothetical protein EDB19DRAFT_1829010 [Suillus lakei]|nr:hypothetical protein EDB19DRAFT_1829010 [Suillus lakei]
MMHPGTNCCIFAWGQTRTPGVLRCCCQYTVRIPQHTTNTNIATAYVDVGFVDNILPSDVLDRIHAYMDISPEDSELGWRLSTDHRSDLPARLKTSFDLKNAFQSARAKRYSGKKEKDVKIEISNLKSISKKIASAQQGENSGLSNASVQPVTPPSPIVHNHIHLRGETGNHNRALHARIKHPLSMYLETDDESDDEPQLPICDVLDIIDGLFPLIGFHQYLGALCHQGIAYLATAVNFDCDFYVSDIGMSRGAAMLFCEQVNKMKMKNDRAVARRKAKGKKRARISHDDRGEEDHSS